MRNRVRVVVLSVALVLALGVSVAPALAWDCGCQCECRSPGYWKNHPCEWPVDTIMVGGVEYSKCDALAKMDEWSHDKRGTMFRSLVAAKLNIFAGCPSEPIEWWVCRGDMWMAENASDPVKANSCAWKAGECIYWKLDAYNNGYLCW